MIALAVILGGSILRVAPYRAAAADIAPVGRKILYYTCPMHPSVKADKPGACPICGMNLVPVNDKPAGVVTNAPPVAPCTNTPATKMSCCLSGGCR